MKVDATTTNILLIGGGLVAGYLVLTRAAGETARAAGQAVNPVNPDNVFARGANSVTSALAGRETTLGGEIFEFFQRLKGTPPFDPNAPAPDLRANVPENVNNDRVIGGRDSFNFF